MNHLKDKIIKSPALCRLDYESGREVVFAVNTSVIAVSFILLQEGKDGKCYPNCFGTISLTSIESQYSQAKLKLSGLHMYFSLSERSKFSSSELLIL